MRAWKALLAAFVATLALAASGSAAAQAPDPFARELARKLAQAESTYRENGFMRAAGPFATDISRDQTRRIPLTLRAGEEYLIVGVCDTSCGEPLLRLADPNERTVARSAMEAGAATMLVRPASTGLYGVDIETPRCAGECWYALNVYVR